MVGGDDVCKSSGLLACKIVIVLVIERFQSEVLVEESGSVGSVFNSWRNLVIVCTKTSLFSGCWLEEAAGAAVLLELFSFEPCGKVIKLLMKPHEK